jgi:pimeloyl-[acyl-carrier protein] methyl ester esterase
MHIETLGAGADIVLIHGWAMHAGIFAPLTRLLATRFRVHLVDLPGHGLSSERDTCDPRACAEALTRQVPRAIWLGWSLGGIVALQAALTYPERVSGVVEIAASPRFVVAPDWPHGVAHELFAQFGAGLERDYRGTIERFLALEALGSDHAQAELRELRAHVYERGEPSLPALHDGLRVLDVTDLRARLAELRMPSLWLAGRRDRLVPAAAMRWAAQQCPQGRFVEMPSGHAPFIGHADEVASAIDEFAGTLAA